MNKKIITLLAALLISSTASSQIFAATNAPKTIGLAPSTVKTASAAYINDNTDITSKFTDSNFKAKLYSILGKSISSPILYSDVKNIKSLDVRGFNISDLSGIEYFTSLNTLSCAGNNLTSLDLSENTMLTALDCSDNHIKSLDLSKNQSLQLLMCWYNNLKILNLTANKDLGYLDCSYNEIRRIYLNSAPTFYHDYTNQFTDSAHTKTTDDVFVNCTRF